VPFTVCQDSHSTSSILLQEKWNIACWQ
jgi:hypothetical protein